MESDLRRFVEGGTPGPIFNERRFTYYSARIRTDKGTFTDSMRLPADYEHIFLPENQRSGPALPEWVDSVENPVDEALEGF
jgi:hypothetical protein